MNLAVMKLPSAKLFFFFFQLNKHFLDVLTFFYYLNIFSNKTKLVFKKINDCASKCLMHVKNVKESVPRSLYILNIHRTSQMKL